MVKLIIYHLFAAGLVLICSGHQKREKIRKSRGRLSCIQPLFDDKATRVDYQS